MPEPFALALFCPHCGGANTLQYSEWEDDAPQVHTVYQCPWCRKIHGFKSPGRFLWVTKGHDPDKPRPD